MLNSCKSAVSAGLGGPSNIGLASALADSGQAVISHLWPVGWKESAAFGGLLALGLAGANRTFASAYAYAVDTQAAGGGDVDAQLRLHPRTVPFGRAMSGK